MSEQLALDWTAARAARDAGIQRAVDHAEAVVPRWADTAFAFLLTYLAGQSGRFTSEDVRLAASSTVPVPPNERAWGGIFQKAAKRGLIVRDGYTSARDPKVHCNVVTVWVPAKGSP